VRSIVDAQLPPALARMLVDLGHEAQHVLDLNLQAVDDSVIWGFALEYDVVRDSPAHQGRGLSSSIPSKYPHTGGGLAARRERRSSGALALVAPSPTPSDKTDLREKSTY
jgi:hypothetical protein